MPLLNVAAASSLELHNHILSGISRPLWLKEGTLFDNVWMIATEDEQSSHGALKRVHFDTVLAPSVLSSHPELEHDLITAKLLVIYGLSASDGSNSAASTMPQLVRNYFQYVRWRLSRGIPRNSDLTSEWLDDLYETIAHEGILGLVPLNERMHSYAQGVREGSIVLPTYEKGRRRLLLSDSVAIALGVQDFSQLPVEVKRQVAELAVSEGCSLKPEQQALVCDEPPTSIVADALDEEPNSDAKQVGLTSERISAFLKPIAMLAELRHRLSHDPISFAPFSGERSAFSVGRSLASKSSERTMTVPSYQACYLINSALEWVIHHAPDLMDYVKELNRVAPGLDLTGNPSRALNKLLEETNRCFEPTHPPAQGSPWPLHDYYSPGRLSVETVGTRRPSLRVALYDYLAVACMIVIAAFSARRREEIVSLLAGCIKFENGEPWMETWIAKTLRSLDLIPVPQAVVQAVKTLEWLSKLHREETGRPWLFEFQDPAIIVDLQLVDRSPRFSIYRALDRFALFVSVPLLEDGTRWVPKPHEFRRFFGVTYYHHYRFAHLAALSDFYRHFDPDMTRTYVTEAARGGFLRRQQDVMVQEKHARDRQREYDLARLQDFEAEAESFRTERFTNVALDRERMGGHGGEQLTAQLKSKVDYIKTVLEISPDDDAFMPTLGQMIAPIVDETRLEPNSLGHSYCKCTTHAVDLRQAACLKRREAVSQDAPTLSAPDPAYASDTTCSGCAHNVQFEENKPYWDAAEDQEERVSNCALAPLLRALAESRLGTIREHKARCF